MFPESALSAYAIHAGYEHEDFTPGKLYDYELAGVALNDGSQGLQVQYWVCWVTRSGEVRVRPKDASGNGTLLFTQSGIDRISFSFDRNMQPAVAYEVGGEVRFRWFDSTAAGYTTSVYPSARTPRVVHDDTRPAAADRSDVVITYLRNDQLLYRVQRERYLTEHVLREGLSQSLRLVQMGMNRRFRVQIEAR